jgi:hypothetical protein
MVRQQHGGPALLCHRSYLASRVALVPRTARPHHLAQIMVWLWQRRASSSQIKVIEAMCICDLSVGTAATVAVT